MSRSHPENLAASVRQKLLNLSVSREEDPNLILTRYALERLLYRLSHSEFARQFVLKGAMLFAYWTNTQHRPTRDLYLLGFGEASNERLQDIFKQICEASVEPDGLVFEASSIRVTEIREGQAHQGQRVKLVGLLGAARIPGQVDVGFGDIVTPDARENDYPTLLDLSAPRIRAYPPETVVAEKLEAMVSLGMQNSRMKDFYDLWIIGSQFSFNAPMLVRAVRATFERRGTDLPRAGPTGLSEEFAADEQKITQWNAFMTRNQLAGHTGLSEVVDQLRHFLLPVLVAAENGEDFDRSWANGGPWTSNPQIRL
jgi:predicted nucleotidyltransferase component of viral defense system